MHGDELDPVGKRGLHLHVVDHLGDAVHHLLAGDHLGACLHQIGNAAAVARALHHEVGDESDRFGMVELDAALQPPPGHDGGHGDQQLVLLAGGEVHVHSLRRP